MYYKIRNTLEAIRAEEIFDGDDCYVAVISPEKWARDKEKFNMGIDLEFEIENLFMTKAEVNYDSLTGSFIIPDRSDLLESSNRFAFALDERGIVFIDHDGYAASLVKRIAATKKWRYPGLERFIYDFLETIISGDLNMLERYEDEITIIEDRILEGNLTGELERNNEIRGELLRFFELFTARVTRLQGLVSTLKEYTMQVRELYQSELSVKQNRIMTVLTVVTTIIMPLTLVTGWYGMNFKYMPELDSPLAYPIVIGVVILMAVSGIIYFKKKKWL